MENYNENSMMDIFDYLTVITIYKNGEKISFQKSSKEYETIFQILTASFNTANLMPALGVSLHQDVVKALKKESWLKLEFSKPLEKNGLTFDALLFKLEDTQGMNLIREYNKRYDGRCIYLLFDEMQNFSDLWYSIS